MKKYPKITPQNFKEITDKLVSTRYMRPKWWTYHEECHFIKVPFPETRQDFFDMTKTMFWVWLWVTWSIHNYEIDGIEDVYSELPIPKLWDKKYSQYDGLKVFLEYVFWPLSCGGVARSHYWNYKIRWYRHKMRLLKFWQSQFVPSESFAKEKLARLAH